MKKNAKNERYRQYQLVMTTDDWYPNLNEKGEPDSKFDWVNGKRVIKEKSGSFVRVGLLELVASPDYPNKWRVCIWGGDDFGLEQDFLKFTEAKEWFKKITELTFVTQDQLRDWGFYNA